MNALVLAYPERDAVNKADASTLTQQYLLDEQGLWNGYFLLQPYKAIVGYQLWEKVAQMPADILYLGRNASDSVNLGCGTGL